MLSLWRHVGFRPLVSGSQSCFSIMLILAALGGLAGCGLPFGNTQSLGHRPTTFLPIHKNFTLTI